MIGLSESYGGDPWLMDFGPTYPMMTFGHIFLHFPILAHASEVGHGDLITSNIFYIFIAYFYEKH